MKRLLPGFLIVIAAVMPGCPGEAVSPVQQDSAPPSAISFDQLDHAWSEPMVYQNGEGFGLNAILESLGGGVGVLDFDRDGQSDLWFPQGGTIRSDSIQGLPSRLLRRSGPGYEDVSAAAGMATAKRYSHGCATADFDEDGFPDVLVTGYGGLTLWRNMGDGTFEDVTTSAGLVDDQWSSSAGWGDLNHDGVLDLYVAHYVDWSLANNPPCRGPIGQPDVCPPRQFQGLDDVVYLGQGDGRFADATRQCGLVSGGKGLGVLLADLDNDGDTDVYVANDTTNNFLYLNQGDGRLEERGLISGAAVDDLAVANGSMGIALADFDQDGQGDLWVSNYEDEVFALYRGLGAGNFLHVSTQTGVRTLGTLLVGFGCVTGDFDLDGDEDFAAANGHVVHHPRNAPLLQQPLLLENLSGQRFRRVEPAAGSYLSQSWSGRGLVTLDHNEDGRLDLLFVNTLQPAALLINESRSAGRALRLQLMGTQSNRDAIGARVMLTLADGRVLMRQVFGGGSYLSTSDRTLHFGIPQNQRVAGVEIAWPSGEITKLSPGDIERSLAEPRILPVIESRAVR